MKLFIFGAGASVDAQNQVTYTEGHPERAPLVNNIFSEQYKDMQIDGLNFDIEECRTKIRETGSLEGWLTERWTAIDSLKTDRAKRSEKSWFGNINLYIWNLLNKISRTYPNAQGYSYLLKKLYNEDFGIISFNYDTLLDQSYEDIFSASLSHKEDYLRGNFVKLHGSVNWFLGRRPDEHLPWDKHRGDVSVRIRAIAENIYNGNPMSMGTLEILDPKHSALSDITHIMEYFNNAGYFYPLLFMPLTGKDYSIVSDFKDVMIAKAEEMVRQASDIYLIGYRANDDLIHDLLDQATVKAKLHTVGLASADEIASKVLDRHKQLEKGEVKNKGFSNFVSEYQTS